MIAVAFACTIGRVWREELWLSRFVGQYLSDGFCTDAQRGHEDQHEGGQHH
jgi:hypothetical protein